MRRVVMTTTQNNRAAAAAAYGKRYATEIPKNITFK
jgi:hypothetical protein